MRTLKRFILILFCSLISTFFTVPTFASNIDMNLAQEQNVINRGNSINNNISNEFDINDTGDEDINSISNSFSNTSLDTNTVATVQSVEQFEDNTSSFDISTVINILLLAVGLVIILLAVAILIRLNK